MKIMWVSVLLSVAVTALAGNEGGSGGHGVVCRDGAGDVTSIELLDFYFARVFMTGLDHDLGAPDLSPDQKIDLALDRIQDRDPSRAEDWRARAHDFLQFTIWSTGHLALVNDFGQVTFPPGCGPEQIAVQQTPQFPESKTFTVDKTLWDLLDNDSKAGLILHEVIYQEGIRLGHKDSVDARYFNENLTAKGKLENLFGADYTEFLTRASFLPRVGNLYIRTDDNNLTYYPKGRIRTGTCAGPETEVVLGGNRFRVESEGTLLFYDNGAIYSALTRNGTQFLENGIYLALWASNNDEPIFYENGDVCRGIVTPSTFSVQGQQVTFMRSYDTYFYHNGAVQAGFLSSNYRLQTAQGPRDFSELDFVAFDEDGTATFLGHGETGFSPSPTTYCPW